MDKNWLFDDLQEMINFVGGYDGQFTPKLYKYWIDKFSEKNDNFYIVLTSKCCTVLCSTVTYYICTFTQYIIYYECLSIYKTYKNQKIILNSTDKTRDNTLQYTTSSILLDSMDFTNSSTNRSIFISRSEMWRVFYIIPFLAIVVFFKFQSTIATVQLLFVLGCL